MQFYPVGVQILGVFVNAAPLLAQLHNGADVLGRRENAGLDMGLLCRSDQGRVRVVGGVVDGDDRTVGQMDFVDNAGGGGNEIGFDSVYCFVT